MGFTTEVVLTWSRAVTASSSCFASGLPKSVILALPAAPLARPITVSFVLVSPSTDICAITQNINTHHSDLVLTHVSI